MSVVVETTIGDITIDLFTEERPRTCLNFLKLCKCKYYNMSLIFSIQRNFIAQMGDPTGNGQGGDSVFSQLFGSQARFYEGEKNPIMKHHDVGTVSMVNCGEDHIFGSQFFITLGQNLDSLDNVHLVFGKVIEGMDVISKLNETITSENNRPYKDIRITHTVILHDPFPDPDGFEFPAKSPEPSRDILESIYISIYDDVEGNDGLDSEDVAEQLATKEAEARAVVLEMVGDLPEADVAPPENVLFVCKLNPVTTSEDMMIIFSRFGKIKSCEVITDKKTKNSLQYAFIEFVETKSCEDAYFKMDNVLIDERRIHVDFSQSVSTIKWKGKGRIEYFDDNGKKMSSQKGTVNYGEKKSGSHKNKGHRVLAMEKDELKEKKFNKHQRTTRSRSHSVEVNRRKIRSRSSSYHRRRKCSVSPSNARESERPSRGHSKHHKRRNRSRSVSYDRRQRKVYSRSPSSNKMSRPARSPSLSRRHTKKVKSKRRRHSRSPSKHRRRRHSRSPSENKMRRRSRSPSENKMRRHSRSPSENRTRKNLSSSSSQNRMKEMRRSQKYMD